MEESKERVMVVISVLGFLFLVIVCTLIFVHKRIESNQQQYLECAVRCESVDPSECLIKCAPLSNKNISVPVNRDCKEPNTGEL